MEELNIEHVDAPAAIVEEEAPVVMAEPLVEEVVVVEELTPEPTPEPEVIPEVVPEIIVEEPKAHTPKVNHTVSGNGVDEVLLANCIYKNVYARKSLSVHHLQRRLIELGFKDADADKDGWLGDETMAAINKFQAARGLDVTGSVDAATLTKIFEGDHNVRVVI